MALITFGKLTAAVPTALLPAPPPRPIPRCFRRPRRHRTRHSRPAETPGEHRRDTPDPPRARRLRSLASGEPELHRMLIQQWLEHLRLERLHLGFGPAEADVVSHIDQRHGAVGQRLAGGPHRRRAPIGVRSPRLVAAGATMLPGSTPRLKEQSPPMRPWRRTWDCQSAPPAWESLAAVPSHRQCWNPHGGVSFAANSDAPWSNSSSTANRVPICWSRDRFWFPLARPPPRNPQRARLIGAADRANAAGAANAAQQRHLLPAGGVPSRVSAAVCPASSDRSWIHLSISLTAAASADADAFCASSSRAWRRAACQPTGDCRRTDRR